ncbi:MiaB-like tRNA modifying enzyme [Picrophilus oshimae DSM 9789]|uniref:tRNA-t(6)A37 methylthiotransferase n=2 Tax=Picrophilus oshimae TaxID=46632 RepID=A0A8G2FWD5_PICTO|nr:MiaB-like tRNA modifying enzyme [Picrophilus oshimae DSM 9789]
MEILIINLFLLTAFSNINNDIKHIKSMKVYFESYGCTLEKSEAALYVNKMLQDGGELVDDPERADVSVIGTCVVIKHTEDHMLKRIGELSKKSRNVLVLGCLATVNGNTLESENIRVIKPREFRSFYTGTLDDVKIKEPSILDGIPINQGCTGHCNFCISHISRGKLLSRSPEKIVGQVRMQIESGIREIRITSLDTAAYGKDINTDLADLINSITRLDVDFMLRVGMMEPRNTYDILEKLIDAYKNDKVFKFLHLPVQSGDNRILDSMNREYKIEEAGHVIKRFKEEFPDMVFSTDIIAGYYTENSESMENTYKFIDTYMPDIINITRFSPRPYTPDFSRKTMPSNITKEFSKKIMEMHKEYMDEKLSRYHGRILKVIVTERTENAYLARDVNYRPVIIKGDVKLYDRLNVEIVDHGDTYLIGKI